MRPGSLYTLIDEIDQSINANRITRSHTIFNLRILKKRTENFVDFTAIVLGYIVADKPECLILRCL